MAADTTCWFTGLYMLRTLTYYDGVGRRRAFDEPSTEHLIASVTRLYATLPSDAARQRNKVPACAYVNHCLGSVPVAIKVRVCNELRQEIYGTTVLTQDTPRPAFSLEIKSLIYEVCRKNIEAFCLADKKKVWTKPYIGPNRDIPLWSVVNPYMTITDETLQERVRLLEVLRRESLDFVRSRFKCQITSEMEAALDLDLSI